MGRYALVDNDGTVVNVVVWDGQTDFAPAEQFRAVEVPAAPPVPVEPGGRWNEGGKPEWAPAPRGGQ